MQVYLQIFQYMYILLYVAIVEIFDHTKLNMIHKTSSRGAKIIINGGQWRALVFVSDIRDRHQ